jgi:hypothetical protein
MFGSNVNLTDMLSLIVAHLFKVPDNYLKFSKENSSLESFVLEALDHSSNISDQKLILKEKFKVCKNSLFRPVVPNLIWFMANIKTFKKLATPLPG